MDNFSLWFRPQSRGREEAVQTFKTHLQFFFDCRVLVAVVDADF